jgi:hypothetical protein
MVDLYDLDHIIAENIKKNLDLHSTFQYENFLEQGVDTHFLCKSNAVDGTLKVENPSKYWMYLTDYDKVLIFPKDLSGLDIYSRRAFKYPQLLVYGKLPSLSLIGNEYELDYYFGFEHGSNCFNGIASFRLVTGTTYTNRLYVTVGSLNGLLNLNIDVAKPSDFNTVNHVYRVVLAKNMTFFFIDSRLRAVGVQCLQGSYVNVKENVLPYSIALVPPMPSSITTLLEASAKGRTVVAPSDLEIPLSPYRYRVSDGKDIIPLSLPLYLDSSDTSLAGYQVASGGVTSHPFPLFGYNKKMLYFMSGQSGTLSINVLTQTGNWRAYDSITVSANTLTPYIITGEVVLATVTFTPTTYPANILEAGVNLS